MVDVFIVFIDSVEYEKWKKKKKRVDGVGLEVEKGVEGEENWKLRVEGVEEVVGIGGENEVLVLFFGRFIISMVVVGFIVDNV